MKDWEQQLWTSNSPCEFIEIGLSALFLNATYPDLNAIENGLASSGICKNSENLSSPLLLFL